MAEGPRSSRLDEWLILHKQRCLVIERRNSDSAQSAAPPDFSDDLIPASIQNCRRPF
jgi:hypothetical protein